MTNTFCAFHSKCKSLLLLLLIICFCSEITFAQPANDNCANASLVIINSNGFALGVFTSTQYDLSAATLQTGETFAPSITVSGINKKSIWYKFSLPTHRSIRVSLSQPGSTIQAGNVGFAVYKTNNCLPGDVQISTKLSPIETFGNTFHPCVDAGDYLVQVTGNNAANGPIFITVETAEASPAAYDKPATAYKFGSLTPNQQIFKDVDIECQSIDDANEVCLSATSFKDYTKSIWYTFTTPAYFDYLNTWFASLNTPYGSSSIKIGYRLYQGDGTTTPIGSLTQIGGCDSLLTDLYGIDKKEYKCGALLINTTYTVQLLFHKDFKQTIRFGADWNGSKVTNGPLPVSSLATPNKMGTLSANSTNGGALNTISDVFGCNSNHSQNNCPKSMPQAGVLFNNAKFNLSSFVSFNLAGTSSIFINATVLPCSGGNLLVRLYKQDLTTNCTDLDTTNIISTFWYNTYQSNPLSCLAPGNYVLQVMGIDSTRPKNGITYGSFYTATNNALCTNIGLGSAYTLNFYVRTEVASNKFSLSAPGKFNKINANGAGVMQPLTPYTTYTAAKDTFGCANTVMPLGVPCEAPQTKVSYHEFVVSDSCLIYPTGTYYNSASLLLFKGDADALATTQNVYTYPEKINGLVQYSRCLPYNGQYGCVVPGTYTLAYYESVIGAATTLEMVMRTPQAKHATPATAQNLGDLWSYMSPNINYKSDVDTFTCRDNPATIAGIAPCNGDNGFPATKLIYRQFYLSKPAAIRITNYTYDYGDLSYQGRFTLFNGKATDGLSTLSPVGSAWTCFTDRSSPTQCDALPAGWYTVVSYGSGPNYVDPLLNVPTNSHNSNVGQPNAFYILLRVVCAQPNFNRPYKASIDTSTGQPYKIEWSPQAGHTTAYPVTSKKYTLNKENFDCSRDTSFIRQNMSTCNADNVKVAFYVFKTTQEAYVQVDNIDDGLWSSLYAFDVRTGDSVILKTDTSYQPCLSRKGQMEFCKLQPGTYTLVFFAPSHYTCNSVTPTIYIDQVGYSRFDHTSKAYDFGAIVPDSTWRDRKAGDVNPLNADRAPSNDFFYCTTGAQQNDPDLAACMSVYNPVIYSATNSVVLHPQSATAPDQNYIDRRNLWYTFTIDHPGTVRIKVQNKTPGKKSFSSQYSEGQAMQEPFAIYKSDVDGTLPFSQVVANGLVDSTLAQGLTYLTRNHAGGQYYEFCNGRDEITVYAPPCSFTPTRYYIMVENRNSYGFANVHTMNPNSQVEVSVLFDSVTAKPPKFDHYSQANDMGLVNSGIKKGDVDNFTCATKDLTDPLNYSYYSPACSKTLWYKFTTTVTGKIRYGVFIKTYFQYYYDQIGLYQQIKPGDSTVNGLLLLNPTRRIDQSDGFFGERCITPGTYYILLPGCGAVDEDVYPQIEIIPQAGDFCSDPLIASLNGPGSKVVPVTIDCHTIGTDYGEFNTTLTCPALAKTADYKTSWYRLDITGKDTLDVTVFINEKTNATSTDIKYRLMTGNCGAMQEQSCVQDALTRNTYKCLAPDNSYYIQVFTPISYNGQNVTGDIDLNISAVVHADTCLPAATCIAVANFTPKFDCTTDRDVVFNNFSTYGSSINYNWDFGYNNQKSTAVSPAFFYPALTTDKTYSVKLVITNNTCGKKDSISQTVTILARAGVNLGSDTLICTNGITIPLDATSHTGSTYYWYNGSTQPTLTVGGITSAWVEVSYNGCKTRDTINVYVNPIAKRPLQTKALCNVTTINLDASRGQGEQYKWNTGAFTGSITVAQPGTYWVDVYLKGCTIRDSFLVVSSSFRPLGNDTTLCQRNMPYLLNATVNGADSYKWNDNTTAASQSLIKPGLYWVDINLSGCTFRDTLVVKVDSFKTVTSTARICAGQAFKLPSGKQINISGTYKDTLRNIRGCDSLVTNLTLVVQSTTKIVSTASICTAQSYTLPGGKTVSNPGVYNDTIRYASDCDSLITTLTLTVSSVTALTLNPVICQGQTYTLPSGQVVTASGNYVTTISHPGKCDSIITTNLTVKLLTIKSLSPTICQGQLYNMPSGAIINLAGTFKDTLRYATGCDSLITTVNLTIKPVIIVTKSTTICQGQTYTLPSGKVVSTSSTYKDTIRYINGCDSLVSTITLSVKPVVKTTINSVICFGQLYTFPSGKKVTASGTYNDTIRYVTGCDSLVSVINLTVKPLIKQSVANSICEGQSFTLPSGKSVTAAATYADTIRYVTGCDSLISTITLTVKVVKRITANASICIGQTYILPSGKGVTTAAIYIDTLRYIGGCDSLISNITLSVKPLIRTILNAVICQGQTYTFPSGRTGSITGTYSDTIRYQTGCDSLLTTINLKANAVTRISNTATICEGQTYALPSGRLVALQAVYADTLRYTNGCDSVITNTSLTVKKLNRQSFSTSICTGQTYTLPSGRVVTTARNYLDTVRYISGCDSLISSIALSIKPLIRNTLNPVICQGQSYTFPSGRTGSISGTYSDTIRYQTGCDSLISTVQLTVKPVQLITLSPKICAGQNYILPSGKQLKVSGAYLDTLGYKSGCDSLRYTINLTVLDVTKSTIAATICSGQFYTLPSGRTVNVTGTFVDTVHYKFGCDSLISTTTITLKQAVQTNISAIICAGALYTLPSGRMLNSPGIFSDTLRYIGGCDSSITIVNLVVQPVIQTALSANICQEQTYQLPSGKLINTTGNYSDTLHYTTGCDSVITQVNLFVIVPVTRTVNAEICVGETYRLPSGRVVNTAGGFTDVVKNSRGCDSLITNLVLALNPLPVVTISKSNDINCIVGSATLSATGGARYLWSPSTFLNSVIVSNPIATPIATTIYKAKVTTAKGCVAEGSIELKVVTDNIDGGYLLPSAFTPNSDGKNDCFGVKAWGMVSNLQFSIFDRWGHLLFSTTDPSRCWDGTYNGIAQSTGGYVFSISAVTVCGPVVRKGTVVLIR